MLKCKTIQKSFENKKFKIIKKIFYKILQNLCNSYYYIASLQKILISIGMGGSGAK